MIAGIQPVANAFGAVARTCVNIFLNRKVAFVALGILSLQASQVSAGPITYAACVTGCTATLTAVTWGAMFPFIATTCLRACVPALLAPSP